MGVAVVGGMLTSTFLTLIVIPVVYTVFSELAARRREAQTIDLEAEPTPQSANEAVMRET